MHYINCKTFGRTEEKKMLRTLKLKVYGKRQRIIEAYSVRTSCSPVWKQTRNLAINKYPTLRNMQRVDSIFNSAERDADVLIIGENYYWSFIAGNTVRFDQDFVALDTIMGWILSGSFHPNRENVSSVYLNSTHVIKAICDAQTSKSTQVNNLELFWEIENTGATKKSNEFNSNLFLKTIREKDAQSRYPDHELIPDNFINSLNRLRSSIFRCRPFIRDSRVCDELQFQ